MELGSLDRKILFHLDVDGSSGLKAIAKKAHASPEVVRYHLARLQEGGVIRRFMALVNFSELGFAGYGVFCSLKSGQQGPRWLDYLKLHPRIYWLSDFGGAFDLAFAIVASDPFEFYSIFNEIKEKAGSSAGGWKVAVRMRLVQFPRFYLLPESSTGRRTPYFGQMMHKKKLSAQDFAILKALSQDGRAETVRLSKKTGIPASTVAFRLKKLASEGILQGISPQMSCQQYGYQCYQLFLEADDLDGEKRKALFSYAQSNPNIIFFIETLGDWNFELIYEVSGQRSIQQQAKALRAAFPWIQKIETGLIFDHNVKYDQFPFDSLD